jgi:hypothetical protein
MGKYCNPLVAEGKSIWMKFVSYLGQVSGFLWVLTVSYTNKTDRHDIAEI